MWITWKHTEKSFPLPWKIEDKIEIFYHRIWGWQLHIARLMINGGKSHDEKTDIAPIPHQGFALLQVCMSYFETIGKYESGDTSTKDSKEVFIKGFLSVFPEAANFPYASTRESLNFLYSGARCGLYHGSMTAPGIALGQVNGVVAFSTASKRIVINPDNLPNALIKHLDAYVQKLKDPANNELRKNFERRFNSDNGIK